MKIYLSKEKMTLNRVFFICINLSFFISISQLRNITFFYLFSYLLYPVLLFCVFSKLWVYRRISLKTTLLVLFLLVLGVSTFLITRELTLLKIILLAFMLYHTNLQNVLKDYFISLMLAILFIITVCLLGIISFFYVGDYESAISFGFLNPNIVPIIILALFQVYNTKHSFSLTLKEINVELLIAIFTFICTQSRTGILIMIVYLLLVFISLQLDKKESRILKCPFFIAKYLFILLFITSFFLMSSYSVESGFYRHLNNLLSGRLLAWQNYFNIYSVKILGNNIDTTMFGSFDNSYLVLLLQFGLLTFLFYLILFYKLSDYCYKKKSWVIYSGIIATELYAVSEYGAILVNVCPSLIFAIWLVVNLKRPHFLDS